MGLLSPTFQVDLRTFCSGFNGLKLRQIRDMFDAAGIELGPPSATACGGERRVLTERYLSTVDWESEEDTDKVLKAVTITLFAAKTSPEHKAGLRALCEKEGLRIEGNKVVLGGKSGVGVKNLIFASNGYKPEIVIIDATTNDIKITKNADSCLVYDCPIPGSLLWSDLVVWWVESGKATSDNLDEAAEELYARLEQSLDSDPEKVLMRQYFETLQESLGDKLPALIPQVYLHYDPYTVKARRRRPAGEAADGLPASAQWGQTRRAGDRRQAALLRRRPVKPSPLCRDGYRRPTAEVEALRGRPIRWLRVHGSERAQVHACGVLQRTVHPLRVRG